MRIRWVGPSVTRRIVLEYVWDAANGFVSEVSNRKLARTLLKDGSGLFVVDESSEEPTTVSPAEASVTPGGMPVETEPVHVTGEEE